MALDPPAQFMDYIEEVGNPPGRIKKARRFFAECGKRWLKNERKE